MLGRCVVARRAVFDLTILQGRIVGVDILADPEQRRQLELVIPGDGPSPPDGITSLFRRPQRRRELGRGEGLAQPAVARVGDGLRYLLACEMT